jgi:signal transduction histidine kinase
MTVPPPLLDRLRHLPDASDLLVAGTLLLLTQFEIWVSPIFQTGLPGPRMPLAVVGAMATLPLAWRRVLPLPVVLLVGTAMLGSGLIGDPEQSAFPLLLSLLVAVYSLAAYTRPPIALAGGGYVLIAGAAYSTLTLTGTDTVVDFVVPYMFLAAAWIAGREVGRHRALADVTARAAAQQRELAILGERTRIARELHDIVAHGVSAMGIQAAAARATLEPHQSAAREAMLSVEEVGRGSLTDLHHMLGALRGAADATGHAPTPSLARLNELIAEARAAGLRVEFDDHADGERLPGGIQLTAFRIVQESLTNARKHGARAATVTLRRTSDALEIEVADDGPGAPAGVTPGHGLAGMDERVALLGGEMRYGNQPAGGFVVAARLPVEGRT